MLLAPAPQSVFDEETSGDRRFEIRLDGAAPEEIDALLAREIRFDSDLWLVELELDDLAGFVAIAGPDPA